MEVASHSGMAGVHSSRIAKKTCEGFYAGSPSLFFAQYPPLPCFLCTTMESISSHQTYLQVWDLILVGGGVAGSALASAQARAGRRVLMLERCLSQPNRFVGELLQPGGYLKLKSLGLAGCVEGIDSETVGGGSRSGDGD